MQITFAANSADTYACKLIVFAALSLFRSAALLSNEAFYQSETIFFV